MRHNRGIPEHIGRAVRRGILINKDSCIITSDGEGHPTHYKYIFDMVRSAFGGPVKTRSFESNEYKLRAQYLVVPDEYARLIVQYEKLGRYAGLSLQGFLMKAWHP